MANEATDVTKAQGAKAAQREPIGVAGTTDGVHGGASEGGAAAGASQGSTAGKGRDRRRNALFITGCALAGGLLGALIWYLGGAGGAPKTEEPTFETVEVVREDYEQTIDLTGVFEAADTVSVAPEVAGTIENVFVREGQQVKEGDVLVTLKNDELDTAIDEAQREVDTAQLAATTAQSDAEAARKTRDDAWDTYNRQFDAYRIDMDNYQKTINNAQGMQEPTAPVKTDEMSDEEYQALHDQYLRDMVTYQSAQSAAANAVEPRAPEINDEVLLAAVDNADRALEAANLQLTNAQKALEEAQARAEKRSIVAPRDGVVVSVAAKTGAQVGAVRQAEGTEVPAQVITDPLLVLSGSGTMVVVARVPEVDANDVKVGQDVHVQVPAVKDLTLQARVTEVALAATGASEGGAATFAVRIALVKADDRIKQGMSAKVSIVTAAKDDALVVPAGVLIEGQGAPTVEVLHSEDPYESEQRTVTVGLHDDERAVIEEGLTEGEVLVLHDDEA